MREIPCLEFDSASRQYSDITEASEPFREEPLDLAPLLPFLPWWMDAAKHWGGWDVEVEGWRLDVFGVISLGGAAWSPENVMILLNRFLVCCWHPWISMDVDVVDVVDSCIFLLWGSRLRRWFLLPSQRTDWLLQWLPRPPLHSIYLLEFSFPERVKLLTSLFFGNQYNTRVILLPTPNKCTYFSGNSWKSLQIPIDF